MSKLFPDIKPQSETLESWKEAIDGKISSEKKSGGLKTTNKTFTSTSLTSKKALDTKVMIRIKIRKGQKGMAPIVGNMVREYQFQQEILIEPGRTFLCNKVYIENGKLWIDAELIDVEEVSK